MTTSTLPAGGVGPSSSRLGGSGVPDPVSGVGGVGGSSMSRNKGLGGLTLRSSSIGKSGVGAPDAKKGMFGATRLGGGSRGAGKD